MTKARKTVILLSLIIATVCTLLVGSVLVLLYRAHLSEVRERLTVAAQSQARLIEAVVRHEKEEHAHKILDLYPEHGPALAAALAQVVEAHEEYKGFGETGEFTLARREGDLIVFQFKHRYDQMEIPQPIPFSSEVAEPMRRALSGLSGTLIGLDYRGEQVLAAHEPLSTSRLGIVAKIDMSEVRGEFVTVTMVAGAIASLLILTGTGVFWRVSNPMVVRLESHARELQVEIDERKRTEAALARSEAKYRSIVETSQDIIWMCDTEHRFTFLNPAWKNITGYEIEEGLGCKFAEFQKPEVSRRDADQFDYVREHSGTSRHETSMISKAGEDVPLLLSAGPVLDMEGRVIGMQGTAHDLTQRKKAEKDLAESEAGLADPYENAPDMLFSVDAKTQRILHCNDTLASTLGYPKADLIGRHILDLYHPDSLDDARRALHRIRTMGTVQDAHLAVTKSDGSKLDISLSASAVRDHNGNISHYRSVWHDITERKRIENELAQSSETLLMVNDLLRLTLEPSTLEGKLNRVLEMIMASKSLGIVAGSAIFCVDQASQELQVMAHSGLELSHLDACTRDPLGDCSCRKAAVTQTIQICDDKDNRCARRHKGMVPHLRCCVPLVTRGTVTGVLTLGLPPSSGPEEREIRILDALAGTIADLIDRHRIDNQLRTAMLIVENSPAVLFRWTMADEWPVTFVSDNVMQFGYTSETFLSGNQSLSTIIHNDDLERIRERISDCINQGIIQFTQEFRIVGGDGVIRWVDTSISYDLDRKTRIVHCEAILHNVSDRKQAEEALEERRVFQEAVLEGIAEGIVACDQEGTLVYFNRAAREFLGLPAEPIPPDEWASHYDLCEPDGKTPLTLERVPLFGALNGEKVSNQEIVIAVKGLPVRTVAATGQKLTDSKGNPLGAVVSMIDITERTNAKRQLLTYQEELRALTIQSSLTELRERRRLAVQLHDLVAQPLAIAKIRLGTRRAGSTQDADTSLDDVLEHIDEAITQTRSLTSELSPYTLYELGLEEAVEELCERTHTRYGIQAVLRRGDEPLPLTEDTSLTLFQAIRELLMNVVKYAEAKNVAVTLHRKGDRIEVEVKDDGVGFDTKQLGRQHIESGGFGLFSVKERVALLGGDIEIESKIGEGTKITMTAPLLMAGGSAPEKKSDN